MLPDELSAKERAAMFALLAEARQLSNPELQERVGFRLDGKERRRLNDRKFVESEKVGRAYAHELSDAGWRWCADELSRGPKEHGTGLERALYAVLGGFTRHMRDEGQRLADVFSLEHGQHQGADPGIPDVEARIEAGYQALTRGPGEFVGLRELRSHLAELPRPDVDAALGAMYAEQRVNLIPQSNQRALSAADRESALRIGGEYKHLISIER
jgi:hypothetical protein